MISPNLATAALAIGSLLGATTHASTLKFTGDENVSKIADQLISNSKSLHRETVTVLTKEGHFTGKIVSRGANFLILESDTQRQTMGKGNSSKIISQAMISLDSVIGFQYEILR